MHLSKSRKWTLGLVVCCLSFVLSASLATILLNTSSADAEPQMGYATNEAGETYGSLLESVDGPFAVDPDLVAVVATNGQEGYVYNTDLIAADPMPSSPEEASLRQQQHDLADARIFVSSLSEQLGINISVQDAVALEAYMAARDDLIDSAPGANDAAIDDLGADLTGILPLGEAGIASANGWEGIAIQAMTTIQETNTIEIPVYEQDGLTVIGVFKAGSYQNTADAQQS